MQHTSRSKAVVVAVVVLTALTAVNIGVAATWWGRSAAATPGSSALGTGSPSSTATRTASARPSTTAPTPSASAGIPAAEAPGSTTAPATVDLATTWGPPADMPTAGRLLRIAIPATRSHFTARDALVYLPPAALTADPPPLPVAVLLSGQSRGAGPEDLQTGGHIEETMDALATLNRGLTPIVVVPDQLGPQSANPMCVDGPLGNSATYLEDDVPAWITTHLRVQTGAAAWTIGGFSQGGTCAIQLGAGDPGRFGNLIDVAGEDGPSIGPVAKTIAEGFSGNAAAYRRAQPAALLAAHAPYRSTNAFFAAGRDDHAYGQVTPVQSQRARVAGMHVTTWILPKASHSWSMARPALAAGLSWLQPLIGLAPRA
ncbi:esterase family protein [Curtobacterium sp. VKM Ac-2922]|uniref:alpha/beta hydrolase n=1 Tax=Curtobacterium sp. VKM Ac-2922 TaxID=2929475 RepID=UPI001FB41D65|nr:alpha/beta hydrolase-fold protein [Curtobacterium sp. VKM Ac-2922]MCJ1715177.1 alpha/beta hydrolase-fold protein [Curtobacterium sp. VKM Ac-2922]